MSTATNVWMAGGFDQSACTATFRISLFQWPAVHKWQWILSEICGKSCHIWPTDERPPE